MLSKEVSDMATKSILKNIKVDKSLGKSLASALEQSKESQKPKNGFEQTPDCIEKKNIKKFLGIDKK